MKNLQVAVLAAAVTVVVVVVGVTNGMPLEPEPRQYVFQPDSPSVRMYPVHFERYLKSSTGRVRLMKEDSPVMQAFRPNMLQPETGKTERPSDMEGPTTTAMTPEMEMKSVTTTSTTTSMVTTSEPKRVSMMTMEPMTVMDTVTTLQPQPMTEAKEDTVPQPHTDVPSHNLEDAEPVTEAEVVLEGDSSALLNAGVEAVSDTETMTLMEGEEVEAATEFFYDETETTQGRVVADDTAVTETVPENEVATELPNLRELEVF